MGAVGGKAAPGRSRRGEISFRGLAGGAGLLGEPSVGAEAEEGGPWAHWDVQLELS